MSFISCLSLSIDQKHFYPMNKQFQIIIYNLNITDLFTILDKKKEMDIV